MPIPACCNRNLDGCLETLTIVTLHFALVDLWLFFSNFPRKGANSMPWPFVAVEMLAKVQTTMSPCSQRFFDFRILLSMIRIATYHIIPHHTTAKIEFSFVNKISHVRYVSFISSWHWGDYGPLLNPGIEICNPPCKTRCAAWLGTCSQLSVCGESPKYMVVSICFDNESIQILNRLAMDQHL